MSEHRIRLNWKDDGAPFTYERYSRNHEIAFKEGAATWPLSAAPAYRGDESKPDPEELLVAALSSCHMLSFLAICAKKRFAVESYDDDAAGFLENDGGHLWITRVILRPHVVFAGETLPDAAEIERIHHLAHEACFIANSVKTDVRVVPR